MSSITVAIFILMMITLGSSRSPSKTTELSKQQLEHNVDTAVLLDMLAKLMSAIDEEVSVQGKKKKCNSYYDDYYFVDTSCHSNIPLTTLKELLNSTTTNSSQPYVLTSNGRVFKQATTEVEHTMYDRVRTNLLSDYSFYYVTSVWISKTPCPSCVDELETTFQHASTKPTVYVETLNFNETNVENNLMEHLGCLAELIEKGFTISAWDWNEFKNTFSITNTDCVSAISTTTSNTLYTKKKDYLTEFVNMIQQLEDDNDVIDLCQ